MSQDLERAIRELHSGDKTFVLVRDGEILGTGRSRGVAELVSLADRLGERAQGAVLADRIVGRAAAFVARFMKLSSVYAALLSEPGRELLVQARIEVQFERLVAAILNRAGDGSCPMELLVEGCHDPGQALALLRARAGAAGAFGPDERGGSSHS